jgi:hypothetical protein
MFLAAMSPADPTIIAPRIYVADGFVESRENFLRNKNRELFWRNRKIYRTQPMNQPSMNGLPLGQWVCVDRSESLSIVRS